MSAWQNARQEVIRRAGRVTGDMDDDVDDPEPPCALAVEVAADRRRQ